MKTSLAHGDHSSSRPRCIQMWQYVLNIPEEDLVSQRKNPLVISHGYGKWPTFKIGGLWWLTTIYLSKMVKSSMATSNKQRFLVLLPATMAVVPSITGDGSSSSSAWPRFFISNRQTLSAGDCKASPKRYWLVVLPSGKLTWLWKITIFNGKIHYKWSFSIAMLNYQRVTILKNVSQWEGLTHIYISIYYGK